MNRLLVFLVLSFLSTGAEVFAHSQGYDCQMMKHYRSDCDEFKGDLKDTCQVCRGKRPCLMVYNGPKKEFCEAYLERRSCFMAFRDRADQGWCSKLIEGKSCVMALDGKNRENCEAGKFPKSHIKWLKYSLPSEVMTSE